MCRSVPLAPTRWPPGLDQEPLGALLLAAVQAQREAHQQALHGAAPDLQTAPCEALEPRLRHVGLVTGLRSLKPLRHHIESSFREVEVHVLGPNTALIRPISPCAPLFSSVFLATCFQIFEKEMSTASSEGKWKDFSLNFAGNISSHRFRLDVRPSLPFSCRSRYHTWRFEIISASERAKNHSILEPKHIEMDPIRQAQVEGLAGQDFFGHPEAGLIDQRRPCRGVASSQRLSLACSHALILDVHK